jgi:methylenetetrahydrofolate--tRNA-(uracil-5-)-methyltransferase
MNVEVEPGMNRNCIVIGGGLAGCEAAWQLAERGCSVTLYEMRPLTMTPAHTGGDLAELVCSNSLGSALPDRATGLLQNELRRMGSLLMDCARQSALPAGGALAVDRTEFSRLITERITSHPNIRLVREEVTEIPDQPAVIASGPLTSPKLAQAIATFNQEKSLYFFDAVAPVVSADSINMEIVYRASRSRKETEEEGDYLNCPLDKPEYEYFIEELTHAARIQLKDFEQQLENGVKAGDGTFFESCLPVEVLAARGIRSMAFGPMRPVGLTNPRTGRWPYAVVQLRQDNLAGSLYNLVGFQTNLTYPEQKRVFSLIPGLEKAAFVRYGQMHRNTFMNSPRLLNATMQNRHRSDLFFAGQLVGAEGYSGNIATGLIAGLNLARWMKKLPLMELPPTTMIGAICSYITHADPENFQPMKANMGLFPPVELPHKMGKRERAAYYAQRALADLDDYLASITE